MKGTIKLSDMHRKEICPNIPIIKGEYEGECDHSDNVAGVCAMEYCPIVSIMKGK